jgi:hypothetical protein
MAVPTSLKTWITIHITPFAAVAYFHKIHRNVKPEYLSLLLDSYLGCTGCDLLLHGFPPSIYWSNTLKYSWTVSFHTLSDSSFRIIINSMLYNQFSCNQQTNELNNSMEQSPSWEADSNSASTEISRCLWNPKVHYRVHKIPPLIPILNQMTPAYTLLNHHLKIHSNTILPSTPRSSEFSSLQFCRLKVCTGFLSAHACCMTRQISAKTHC